MNLRIMGERGEKGSADCDCTCIGCSVESQKIGFGCCPLTNNISYRTRTTETCPLSNIHQSIMKLTGLAELIRGGDIPNLDLRMDF